MNLKFFDTHCHTQLSAFDTDRRAVLSRMRRADVGAIVVGTNFETSGKALELAKEHDFLWAAVGLHPTDPESSSDVPAFNELAAAEKVVAIGECGLDFYRVDKNVVGPLQRERFQKHIELARSVNKPLMIHCRSSQDSEDAHEEILTLLEENPDIRAVIHFFTSSPEIAIRYVERGCYVSFPGVITFTDMYDEAVKAVLFENMLSETDSPFATPAPHRGERNEPSYVEEVVRRIAHLKDVSFEEAQKQIVLNAQHAFSID